MWRQKSKKSVFGQSLTVDYNELVGQVSARVLYEMAKKGIQSSLPGFEPCLERDEPLY
jgi:hypothetical protein